MPILAALGSEACGVRYSGLSGEVSAPKSGQWLDRCEGHGVSVLVFSACSVGGPKTGYRG
jgi:hypothetical protein